MQMFVCSCLFGNVYYRIELRARSGKPCTIFSGFRSCGKRTAEKHVSGNVQDANGMPLIGASVIIKGTNTGMITDIEGNFALDAKQGDIIVISYIGMKSAEVKVPANGQIRVMLKEDSQLMDEVVVTGYGDFKKATYTGSASVLNTDKLESLPVVSVAQMMEANIPGLSSVASSSQPGSKATVRVRGIASMNASTEPLYVLDGVPVASRDMSGLSANASAGGLGLIETLNPADIESITVLKDAASASLYGAKGSNGVILITTKKGRKVNEGEYAGYLRYYGYCLQLSSDNGW